MEIYLEVLVYSPESVNNPRDAKDDSSFNSNSSSRFPYVSFNCSVT